MSTNPNASRTRRHCPSRAGQPLVPLRLRVSPTMATGIDAAASAAGLTGAAWVRAVLADRLPLDDLAHRQPVRAYGGGGPDAAALTALRLQLRQTGGLITQGAKEARLAGIATHPDLELALADIKHAIAVIAACDIRATGPSARIIVVFNAVLTA